MNKVKGRQRLETKKKFKWCAAFRTAKSKLAQSNPKQGPYNLSCLGVSSDS